MDTGNRVWLAVHAHGPPGRGLYTRTRPCPLARDTNAPAFTEWRVLTQSDVNFREEFRQTRARQAQGAVLLVQLGEHERTDGPRRGTSGV